MRPSREHISLASLVVALVMTVPTTAVLAADGGEEEPSLCDAITLDELHGLSSLRFQDPVDLRAGGGSVCAFGATETEAGSYRITLGTTDLYTVEMLRSDTPGGLDLTVAGQPAYLVEPADHLNPSVQLVVELGEETFSVLASVEEEAPGLDRDGFVRAIAEIAAGRLLDAAPPSVMADPAVASDITLSERSDATGEDVTGSADEPSFAPWAALLEITGADVGQLRAIEADVSKAGSDEPVGQYSTLSVAGADQDLVRAGVLEFFRTAFGEQDVVVEEATIGGKEVTAFEVGGQRAYLYVSGDTAHILAAPEDIAATLIEQIP